MSNLSNIPASDLIAEIVRRAKSPNHAVRYPMTECLRPQDGYVVEFMPGTGVSEFLPVRYIAGFPRDMDSECAFCHGDPCNETGKPDDETPIARYYRAASWAETCPVCDGRAS